MPNQTEAKEGPQSEASEQAVLERIQALRRELWKYKRKPSGTVGYILLLLGTIALVLSILYTSSILAFIGLALTLWGPLLLYIKPTRYVKASLLDPTAMALLTTIDRVIADFNCKGKPIYLPPRSLKEFKAGKVFIPLKKELIIPPAEEVTEERVFLKNPRGICVTSPGIGLTNLYEDELGTDFTRVDLEYLEANLPQLFTEGLEMAKEFEINTQGDLIHVKVNDHIYKDLCDQARRLPNICSALGCPLCSSIATALTRATKKPVIIENNKPSPDGKTIEIYYRILEE